MLTKNLQGTKPHQDKEQKIWVKSLMDGIATLFGALVPVLPYLFLPPLKAMYAAIAVTSLLGFLVGVMMSKLSRRHIIYMGLKMALIAILVAGASALLQNGLNAMLQ